MKKTIISLMSLLIATCSWAQKVWNNPYSFCDKKDCHLKAKEVEFKKDETIVHMSVKNYPGGMICFPNYCALKDQDGKKYAIKSAVPTRSDEDSCYVGQWVSIPESGIGTYSLHFEPLPESTERFHFIESFDPNGFLVWNIHEPKQATTTELFNSNWRDAQTGDWVLSLFNDNAVYNNSVCKYDEKSDKKVVLNNGKEKTTIVIGKEKDGKRQFTINGKKITLECLGSTMPAYPTDDNTAFNPELTNGEAVIVGWIKDFPTAISDQKPGISVCIKNIITGKDTYVTNATFDDAGQFTLKVKLNGTQGVTFNEVVRDRNIFAAQMVLQPGKQYYMMHDWKNGTCLFMGDDARLQNELQAFPCAYENMHVADYNIKVKSYEQTVALLDNYVAKNPTLSKRYRDFITEYTRYEAAESIIRSQDEIGAAKAADKFTTPNPSLPLSLTSTLSNYITMKSNLTLSQVRQQYRATPELFYSFEKKGMIKFSDSDHELMKKWQLYEEKNKEMRNCKTRQEMMAIYEEMDKIISQAELRAFQERADIKKVYKEWAPNNDKLYCHIIDSLFTDQLTRDYCRTLAVGNELAYRKMLSESSTIFLNGITNNFFKQQIDELKNYYAEQLRLSEEAVKNVIAPSSNVEGLTDGKAIIEKMIEPYKGKIVYMDVWGTWCQPCVQAIKASPKMKEAVKDYDVVYLYFAISSEDAAWKSSIAELGLTKPNYVHYNLPRKQQDAVTEYLKVDGVPFYVLFDKNGNMEKYDRGHVGNIEGFKQKIADLSKR